ncbi:vitamin K epoxide reductase family protein [Actinophytocola sediminis]
MTVGASKGVAWLYVIGGAIGLAGATALLLERLAVLRDPDHVPTCSLNPIISCGSVMDSAQAEAFGFPNPLLGIAAFAVVVTVGVVRLAGFVPPLWFRLGMQVGTAFGVLFVHWLIIASLYDIHALCPYCMVVWVVTIPIFWYTTLDTLRAAENTRRAGESLWRYHSAVLAAWFVIIAALVLAEFWSYWTSLF